MSTWLGTDYWKSFQETYWEIFSQYLGMSDVKAPSYPDKGATSENVAQSLQDVTRLLDVNLEFDRNDHNSFAEKLASISREICERMKSNNIWFPWASEKEEGLGLATVFLVIWDTFGSIVFNNVPHTPKWVLVYQDLKRMTGK